MFSDFYFNGNTNRDYGVIPIRFDVSTKEKYKSAINNLVTEFNPVTNEFDIISQNYTEPMSFRLQLANADLKPIEQEQERALNKWLCKKEFLPMRILDARYSEITIDAVISNPKVIVVWNVVGLEYEITTSAPYAFGEERDETYTFSEDTKCNDLWVENDHTEIKIYPKLEIDILEDGDLMLSNSEDDSNYNMQIKKCKTGEVIKVDCQMGFFESSMDRDAFFDWNKHFIWLQDGFNKITSNLACTINFKFKETRRILIF